MMILRRALPTCFLLAAAFAMTASPALAVSLSLDFTTTGGTVLDSTGQGTGFTSRLPGTSMPAGNDPLLALNTGAGQLGLTSSQTDYNGAVGLTAATNPAIALSSLGFTGSQDFTVSVSYSGFAQTGFLEDIDQVGLIVGTSATEMTRTGAIVFGGATERYTVHTTASVDNTQRFGGAGLNPAGGLDITIQRTGGDWAYTINGLDWTPGNNPDGTAGSPNLNGASELYVSPFASNVTNANTKTVQIDSFFVDVSSVVTNAWAADAPGTWNTPASWTVGVPAAGSDPYFGTVVTGNTDVTLDVNASVNSLRFNNQDGDYRIVDNGGGETLTLTGDAEVNLIGRHWVSTNIAGTAGLNKTGGGELVLNSANSFSGGIDASGGSISVTADGAVPAGNNVHLTNGADMRFFGPDNAFFTGEGAAGFNSGTIDGTVELLTGSILGAFDGADLTISGGVNLTGAGILSADAATLNLSSTSTTVFNPLDGGVTGSIVGGGTVNLDGEFIINTVNITDTIGSWTLVNTGSLTETFGGAFSVDGYTESSGVWTSGSFSFKESTGQLTLGNVWDNDADGNYGDGGNWGAGVAPGAGEDVLFSDVITENRTVTLSSSASANRVIFANAGDGDYFIEDSGGGETLTLTGDAAIDITGRHWIRAEVAGTAGVNISNTGELVLDGPNSFTSGITVDDSNVSVTADGAVPSGNDITLSNTANMRFFGADNVFFTDNGASGFNSGTVDGNVSIAAGSQVSANDGADVTFSGVISGGGAGEFPLLVGANGSATGATVTLTGANTYAGNTQTWVDSVLTVSGAGTLGVSDGTVANGTYLSADGQLALDNVALGNEYIFIDANAEGEQAKIASTGNSSISGNLFAGNFGDIANGERRYEISSTGGTLTLGGALSSDDVAGTQFTYVFSGDGDTVVNKIIDAGVDADGNFTTISTVDNVGVVKRGSGTLTIATMTDLNDDYHFGDTVIEEGTLEVMSDGLNNGELRSDVQVQAGATFDVSDFATYNLLPITPYEVGLSGGGTVVANTIGVFESATISPGDSVGTLKVTGNVNLAYFDADGATVPNTGSFNFELGDDATINATDNAENDLIAVSGSMNVSNSFANQFVVNVAAVDGGFDTTNNYTLIRAGSFSGAASNFAINFVGPSGAALTTRYTATPVVSGNELQANIGGAPLNLVYTGSPSNNWDVAGNANFSNGSAQQFFDLDNVTFNASGGTVNVTEAVAPNAMTVSNENFVFVGSDINASSVTVNSNGIAHFDNTVSGDVTVESTGTVAGAGTFNNSIAVQSGGALRVGAASLPLANDPRTSLATNGNWTSVFDNGGGDITENSNIVATDMGNSLQTIGGTPWRGAERDISGTDAAVLVDETQTYFWQVRAFDNTGAYTAGFGFYDFMMGLSADVSNVDETNAYQDYSVRPLVDNGAATPFVAAFDGTQPWWTGITADVWTNIWVTIDNDAATPVYEVYVSDGVNPPVQITNGAVWGPDGGPGAGNDLNAIAFMAAGQLGSEFWVDNIYYSESGLNLLTNPLTDGTDWNLFENFDSYAIGSPIPVGEDMIVLGDVSLAAGSTATFDIAGNGIGDTLDITGDLTVEDGFILELLLDPTVMASSLVEGNSWNLFDFANASGLFDQSDFLLPTLSSGLSWDTSNLLTTGVIAIVANLLPGDANGDGAVDILDLDILSGNFGTMGGATLAQGDFNGDGNVDILDLDILSGNFGAMSSTSAAVPEPATLLLGTLAAAAVLAPGRRR